VLRIFFGLAFLLDSRTYFVAFNGGCNSISCQAVGGDETIKAIDDCQALLSHLFKSLQATSNHSQTPSDITDLCNMSSLRPQRASRLLRPLQSSRRHGIPLQLRYASEPSGDHSKQAPSEEPAPKSDSSTAPGARAGESAMIRQEDSREAQVSHQPNFRAPVDHGTS